LSFIFEFVIIVAFFYTYTGSFGIESLILDIFSFLLAVTVAQLFSLHIIRHSKPGCFSLYVAVAVLLLFAASFTIFTFAPPNIPVFLDSLTGTYGI
jgi:hypothetical protein